MGRGQAETDPPALGAMPTDSAAAYRIQTTAPTTAPTNSAYQATLDGNSKAAAAYLRNAATPADKLTETPSSGRSLPQLGEWSRYELLGQLGQGGMGTVYKARDRRLGRIVAIKFIRDQDESLIERFTQEAQAQARIEHPNICKVYEVGEVAGKAYIAMQYVAGQPLDKLQRILTIDEKVAILATTAEAIEAAHQAGILHRDIKPANIMVQCDGDGPYVPVVMDFGLAREANQSRGLTESGAVLGTPVYMPPEQARGEVRSLDARSDVYSLGATLFELLTGEPPFADDTVVNVLFQVISREAPSLRSRNPGLPVALDTICARCLAKDKEQRYPSAKALAEDLRRALNAQRIVATRVSFWYRLRWRARQNPAAAALILALLASLVGFASYGVYARYKAQREAELARTLAQDSNEVEWLLRAAYLLPLHDTAAEQAMVRQRLESLRAQLAHTSGRMTGLIHYAIGRGHLALHEFDAAENPLRQALALGIELPELHYGLGRVLGERYHRQLAAARYSGDPSFLAARKKELEQTLLQPALSELSHSRGLKLASPQYLDGLIAYYRQQYDAGLQNAEAAATAAPWLYEAVQLQGDILLLQGTEQQEHGDYDRAAQSLQAAADRYERAATIGRSDASVHSARTEAYIQAVRLAGARGQPADSARAAALRAAEATISAAPAQSVGYTKKAYALFWQAISQSQSGADPGPTLEALRESAQAAIARNLRDAVALDVLGNSWNLAGGIKEDRNEDPLPELRQAEQYLTAAVQADERFPWAWSDLALNYQSMARCRVRSGQDPVEDFNRALRAAAHASTLDPQAVNPYNNALGAYVSWSNYLLEKGEDPSPLVEQARAIAEKLFTLNPRQAMGHFNQGSLEKNLTRYQMARQQDPSAALAQALVHLQTANEVQPNFFAIELALAQLYQLRAQRLLAQRLDPAADLEKARVFVQGCRTHNPESADCLVAAAQLETVAAAGAKADGQSLVPALLRAIELATQAIARDKSNTDARYELAQARYQLLHAQPRTLSPTDLESVLAPLDEALRINPNHAPCLALRGAALLLRARLGGTDLERRDAARQARDSFARATRINSLLANGYKSKLELVDRILAGAIPPNIQQD